MFAGHTVISLILTYKYLILFPLACIEGPILSLIVGFLIHLGYFNVTPAFLLMCSGDLFPDIIYYYVGHFGHKKNFLEKYGSRSKFIVNNFSTIEKLWHEHTFKTMFLSKLAYGLSTILLITAGLSKVSIRKFILYAFPITLFQQTVIMSLGYSLGYSYTYATKYIELAGVILAVALVVFIFGYNRIQKRAKSEFVKLERLEELEEQKTL